MTLRKADIPGVITFLPTRHEDERGFFVESFNSRQLSTAGVKASFVQDNYSRSLHGVVRGLHYQTEHVQGKFCCVVRGEVYDVIVDLRRHSPTFLQWTSICLSESTCRQVYIPGGCAHGFCVVSDVADFFYKCTAHYCPDCECTIAWDDPDLAIPWPVEAPLLSNRDANGLRLRDAPTFGDDRQVGSG